MSKFVKGSLITAISIMLVGSLIYMIGLAGGGQKDVRQMEENGDLEFGVLSGRHLTQWDRDHRADVDFWDDEAEIAAENAEWTESPEASDQNSTAREAGRLDTSSVNKLDIELGYGRLYIQQDSVDEARISVETENDVEVVYYVKNGTLHIEGFSKKDWNWGKTEHPDKNNIYVTLPYDMEFKESEIELGAGYIEINGGSYGKTSFEVGAGEIACNGIKTGKLEAEVGAGAIEAYGIEAGEIDFSVDLGAVTVSEGMVNGNIELSCDMGGIMLELKDEEEDYNYEIDCNMGSIILGSMEYAGLGREKYVDNNAAKKIKADCDMGSIEVIFLE